MKFFDKDGPSPKASRAPHGARGLKCVEHGKRLPCVRVAPRTGRVD